MTDTLKTYMSRNVPRYTSYPTAPHFSKAIGPSEYANWLSALPSKVPVLSICMFPIAASFAGIAGAT
jgi:oxygen-independent coproporphyrinogen III oxidase